MNYDALSGDAVDSASSLGKTDAGTHSEMVYWMRPTYYSPPRDTALKAPNAFARSYPASKFVDRLLKA